MKKREKIRSRKTYFVDGVCQAQSCMLWNGKKMLWELTTLDTKIKESIGNLFLKQKRQGKLTNKVSFQKAIQY